MVLNPTGCDPYIANAYMRIGTGSTKLTDNLGYGGVSAKVDVDTGRFYDGTQLKNHVITSCPNHPDTGMLIEGQLPEWDKVKQTLTDICNYFGQLEYLGFDVAISSQGHPHPGDQQISGSEPLRLLWRHDPELLQGQDRRQEQAAAPASITYKGGATI